MNKNFFFTAILVMVLVFGMTVVGCENDPTDDNKEIDAKLIGKWEWQALTISGTRYNLPLVSEGINTGGYSFTSNSLTSYLNGSVAASFQGMYTEKNTIYAQNGQAGYTYSINGNTLTANAADGSSGVIANKVTKFSWE